MLYFCVKKYINIINIINNNLTLITAFRLVTNTTLVGEIFVLYCVRVVRVV